jgi:hypothetical protein
MINEKENIDCLEQLLLKKLEIPIENAPYATIYNNEIGFWFASYISCNISIDGSDLEWICLSRDKEKVDIFKHMIELKKFFNLGKILILLRIK